MNIATTVAGPGVAPPYFWIKLKPGGPKKIFWETAPPPLYLKVGLDDQPLPLI